MPFELTKKQPKTEPVQRFPAATQNADPQHMEHYLQNATDNEHTVPISLPYSSRARMKSLFGPAFSSVRLVQSDLPRRLGTTALAQGDLIRFAPGAFSPDTESGKRLLAHELAHVVQQSRGIGMDGVAGMPSYDPATERAADAMAQQVMDGDSPLQVTAIPSASQAPMLGCNMFDLVGAIKRRPWKISKNQLTSTTGQKDNYKQVHKKFQEIEKTGRDPSRTDQIVDIIYPEVVGTPVEDAELSKNVKALEKADTLAKLETIFGEKVLKNKNFTSQLSQSKGNLSISLDKVKKRLIAMTRMIRDFPELKDHIGNFVLMPKENMIEEIMAAQLALGTEKSNIKWSPLYVPAKTNTLEMARVSSGEKKGNIGHGLYDGVHELGHIINMILATRDHSEKELNTLKNYSEDALWALVEEDLHRDIDDSVLEDWINMNIGFQNKEEVKAFLNELSESDCGREVLIENKREEKLAEQHINQIEETARKIVNNAIRRIANSQKKKADNPWAESYIHFLDNNNGQEPDSPDLIGSDAPQNESESNNTENTAKTDWEKAQVDQTSAYGRKNRREMVAEAFADVYENGAEATVLNKEIVKVIWLELHPEEVKMLKNLKMPKNAGQSGILFNENLDYL
ncbi:MAG: DUF4157 domain-containing protein [Acetatifactor sp.]|nr:DUF4157 domain-containing protein [Acetatifactor sp.]